MVWVWSKFQPINRLRGFDEHDAIYRTAKEKYTAIVEEIAKAYLKVNLRWLVQHPSRNQSICRCC